MLLVRPALVVADWCRWFDTNVIDGIVNCLARVHRLGVVAGAAGSTGTSWTAW